MNPFINLLYSDYSLYKELIKLMKFLKLNLKRNVRDEKDKDRTMQSLIKIILLTTITGGSTLASSLVDKQEKFFNELFSTANAKDIYLLKQSNRYKSNFGYLRTNYTLENTKNIGSKFIHNNLKETTRLLRDALLRSGAESVNHYVLQRKALEKYRELQDQSQIGAFYTLCYQEEVGDNGANTCEVTEYSPVIQDEIAELFSFQNISKSFSKEQMELKELNAIRIASKILEENSFLKDDKGGWSGNAKKSMRNKSALTRCGNETFTYLYFLSDLNDNGFIKNLNVYKSSYAIRPAWFGAEHQAVQITGLHTKQDYIIDSWLDHGGKMARILKKEDWKKKKDKRNIVPGERSF